MEDLKATCGPRECFAARKLGQAMFKDLHKRPKLPANEYAVALAKYEAQVKLIHEMDMNALLTSDTPSLQRPMEILNGLDGDGACASAAAATIVRAADAPLDGSTFRTPGEVQKYGKIIFGEWISKTNNTMQEGGHHLRGYLLQQHFSADSILAHSGRSKPSSHDFESCLSVAATTTWTGIV
jgi:hypothetical protein